MPGTFITKRFCSHFLLHTLSDNSSSNSEHSNIRNVYPTNTPRVFYVEMRWKQPFPRRFNVEYTWCVCRICFFLSGFYFTDIDDSQDTRGKKGSIFYSNLPLPPAHKHSDIYLQLCMWDDYHVFVIATLVFTRLLLNEIYHLIELPFDWLIDNAMFVCLLDDLILVFCYSNLIWETGRFELGSTRLSPLYYMRTE